MLQNGSDMCLIRIDMFFLRMEMSLLGNYMLLPGNNMIHPEVLSTVGKLSKISILCGQTAKIATDYSDSGMASDLEFGKYIRVQ